jgi:hypothetical protein
MAWAIVARRALSPSTPRAQGAPLRLRGVTAQRGQASGYHANNAKKRLSGYPAAFSTGTRLTYRSPRSVTNFVSHTWGAVQNCHPSLRKGTLALIGKSARNSKLTTDSPIKISL